MLKSLLLSVLALFFENDFHGIAIVHSGHLGESRSVLCGHQLLGQAANLIRAKLILQSHRGWKATAVCVQLVTEAVYCSSFRGKCSTWFIRNLHVQGSAYLLSNSAALQILAKSTDVLFDANEDVFVTGICRSVARISCKTVPGFGITEGETMDDCDVVSGRVISIHNVTSAQRVTKLWSFLYDDSASKLRCGSTMSTPPVVVACVATVALLAVLCLLLVYRRKPLSAVLRKR